MRPGQPYPAAFRNHANEPQRSARELNPVCRPTKAACCRYTCGPFQTPEFSASFLSFSADSAAAREALLMEYAVGFERLGMRNDLTRSRGVRGEKEECQTHERCQRPLASQPFILD